jgi:hypothetical protein
MSDNFTFEISLSVLNHLGRNLYRSFATVLGEAISNSWDANAENVHIYIDKKNASFFIKDDGIGMTADDFQNKFLKIGYSKRKERKTSSGKERPYIGRKGIGKLALLSCADRIAVISKVLGGNYVGGVIDNSGLDQAIKDDLTPDKYPLGDYKLDTFGPLTEHHEKGTIIYFENIKEGIKHSLDFLKKTVALYFRFSLLDKDFTIHVDGKPITHDSLKALVEKTQFLWEINELEDPFIEKLQTSIEKLSDNSSEIIKMPVDGNIKGFIASVYKPRDLTILTMSERVGVDLFVNGRLRERNILSHIPTARIPESYLYGQIHFDELDDEKDRFTTSREGIHDDDPKYADFLQLLKDEVIQKIVNEWDKLRRKHRGDGDPENISITKKERKAEELYNVVADEYELPKGSGNKKEVDEWVDSLSDDAKYNFTSYAECFISENLIRRFIEEKKVPLSKEAKEEIKKWQDREADSKGRGNISIEIRKAGKDVSYLAMDDLTNLVDKKDPSKEACLSRDAKEYKPMRDALAHTSLLTDAAKQKLTSVYENIKGRLRTLLSE